MRDYPNKNKKTLLLLQQQHSKKKSLGLPWKNIKMYYIEQDEGGTMYPILSRNSDKVGR